MTSRPFPSLAVLLVLGSGCGLEAPPGTPIRRALMVVSADAVPPRADDPGWQEVALPDRWSFARRRLGTLGWYRATLELPSAPADLWAIALPLVVQNAAVRVNGEPVGNGGPFAPRMARNWNHPLLVTVPPGLLHAGRNRIEVRLGASGVAPPVLGELRAGPAATLRRAHARLVVLQAGVAKATTVAALVLIALLALLLRHRGYFIGGGWFLAALVLLTATSVDAVVHVPPVPIALWEWLVTNARTAAVLCVVAGIHRHLDIDRRREERRAWLAWGGCALVLAVVPALWLLLVTMAVYALAVGAGARAFGLLVRHRRRTGALVAPAFVAVGLACVLLAVHDVLRLFGEPVLPLFLAPWAFTVLVVAEGAVVAGRLVRAWGGLVALNRDLETRVETKHAELEQTWARVRDLERERIVAEERRRITRDIHDGLGGHLVTTLAMLESEDEFSRDDVGEALRGALDDLRVVIDSLDPRETDVVGVLATVRARLEPRLRRRGLAFRWEVADLPASPDVGPQQLLRVLRVVQEAITNVVKHAGATTITVRTGVVPGRGPFVSVSDDGCGFVPECAEGRGLLNMRRRAAELGGRLEIDTGPAGTTVTLWLSAGEPQGFTSPS